MEAHWRLDQQSQSQPAPRSHVLFEEGILYLKAVQQFRTQWSKLLARQFLVPKPFTYLTVIGFRYTDVC